MREHSDRQSQWNDSYLVNEVWLASQGVQQFLGTARRYRWLLATVCALIWSAGLTAAYDEYATTYESHATIWVLQASAEMAASIADQPDIPLVNTAASQQTELLTQLLQTRSFVRDVVERTSLRSDLAAAGPRRHRLRGFLRRSGARPVASASAALRSSALHRRTRVTPRAQHRPGHTRS